MCQACGHAQLLDVVDPNVLFGNYIYTSSSSPDFDRSEQVIRTQYKYLKNVI